jgi:hypothetical protein
LKITKEKSSHKIDVVVALGMAALGAVQGGISGQPLPITAEIINEILSAPRRPAFGSGGLFMGERQAAQMRRARGY